jgi:hypothetical protein
LTIERNTEGEREGERERERERERVFGVLVSKRNARLK